MKATAGPARKQRFREPAALSIGGLHAKTFAFDRRIAFIGSYNLDPRSNKLDTEMGVVFNCPPLAKRLPEQTERSLPQDAYRVQLEHHRLVWVTHEGGKEVRYTSEPQTSFGKRPKSSVLSVLPIEGLL